MCIFLMVATNEICKFKVKFTLFSPSPVILNDDIHWTKLILFFEIDFFFLIWHIRGLFGFLQFMRRKGTHSLATTLNCIWLKKINVLFGKFLLFYELYIDHRTPENSWFTADWRSSTTRVLLSHMHEYICSKNVCEVFAFNIYIPYKYESVLIVFQLYFG